MNETYINRRILHYYNSEFEKGATDHSD